METEMKSEIESCVAECVKSIEPASVEMDDFEKMIMAEAGRAVSMLEKKKPDVPEDIEAVVASINMMGETSKTIEKIKAHEDSKKESKKEVKAKKTSEKKSSAKSDKSSGLRSEKYGEAVLRPDLPEWKSDTVRNEDETFLIAGNRIDWIKSELKRLGKDYKFKKAEVYVVCDYVFTTYHKLTIPDGKLQIEGVGKTFINLTLDDVKWAILPNRQDESFKLLIVPKK